MSHLNSIHQGRLSTLYKLAVGALVTILFNIAHAQHKGDVVENQYKAEYGGLVTLPAGKWTVVDSWKARFDSNWHVTILLNNDKSSVMPLIIVRVSTIPSRQYDNPMHVKRVACDRDDSNNNSVFMRDDHGTKSSDLLNKCSRIRESKSIANFAKWTKANDKDNGWWKEAFEHMGALPEGLTDEAEFTDSEIRSSNKHTLIINIFIKTQPFGVTGDQIKAARIARGEHAVITNWRHWVEQVVDANVGSFFNNERRNLGAMDSGFNFNNDQSKTSASSGEIIAKKIESTGEIDSKLVDTSRIIQPKVALIPAAISSYKVPKLEAVVYSRRKALVIGNNSYRNVERLKTAGEDARAMAEGLKRVGYKVTLKTDLDLSGMKETIRNFKAQVQGGDEVLIFYAGHGVQIGNTNFLLPIDITAQSEEQVKDDAIELQRLLDDLVEKRAKFTLAMIDACRDNPFKSAGRSLGGRGLSPTTAATGQMIVFSAGAGQQALDNLGPNDKSKNGVFTRVFLKQLDIPGVTVDRLVRNVRAEIVALAKSVGREQVPAIYDQVVGDFYFQE